MNYEGDDLVSKNEEQREFEVIERLLHKLEMDLCFLEESYNIGKKTVVGEKKDAGESFFEFYNSALSDKVNNKMKEDKDQEYCISFSSYEICQYIRRVSDMRKELTSVKTHLSFVQELYQAKEDRDKR